jgi:hypothetical protein
VCRKHRWQPITLAITTLALLGGLFQDVAKPLYEQAVSGVPSSTYWYVGYWKIDAEKTLASLPQNVGLTPEDLRVFATHLASARVEIEGTRGRIINPNAYYKRRERNGSYEAIETRALIEFNITPSTDEFAIPTLVQPTDTKIVLPTATMSGIYRIESGIYIEGAGATSREVYANSNGYSQVVEQARTMRMYLYRASPTPTPRDD